MFCHFPDIPRYRCIYTHQKRSSRNLSWKFQSFSIFLHFQLSCTCSLTMTDVRRFRTSVNSWAYSVDCVFHTLKIEITFGPSQKVPGISSQLCTCICRIRLYFRIHAFHIPYMPILLYHCSTGLLEYTRFCPDTLYHRLRNPFYSDMSTQLFCLLQSSSFYSLHSSHIYAIQSYTRLYQYILLRLVVIFPKKS